MKKLEFTVKLEGEDGSSVAWLNAPFNVEKVFGTRARVPVCGTINGFPFRSSLMPMGGCHGMAVNQTMRAGAGCKAGDAVNVVMERDQAERVVEVPPALKKSYPKARPLRPTAKSSRTQVKRRLRFRSARPNRKKPAPAVWRKSWAFSGRARSGPASLEGAPLPPQRCSSERGGSRQCRLPRFPGRIEHSPV